jgi:hypothetical protein
MGNASELVKVWNNLHNDDKLEIIENGIDAWNVSDGLLQLRLYKKTNKIEACIVESLENHLCTEAVSQDTLATLFNKSHFFEEGDAKIILNWINSQK